MQDLFDAKIKVIVIPVQFFMALIVTFKFSVVLTLQISALL
jgi:hypothetical protein